MTDHRRQEGPQSRVTGCSSVRHRLGLCRIAELHATLLGRLKASGGALADHPTLLFGERGVDVQGERIDIASQRADDEGNTLRHQAGDEYDIAAQTVELGDGNSR